MALRSLVPWRKEEEPFTSLQKAVNTLFDDFFRGWETPLMAGRDITKPVMYAPDIDLSEDDKEIHITAELPGMEQKDIDVYVADDHLTIKGEKKAEHEEKRRNYYRRERSYGSFQRMVPLPADVDTSKVNALFKNGVLTINLTKTAEAQKAAKKIEVKAS